MWWFIKAVFVKKLHFESIEPILIGFANYVLFALVVLLSTFYIFLKKKVKNTQIIGIIALLLITYNVFSKYSSFHQFLPAFVFFVIWDTIRSKEYFPVIAFTYAFLLFSAGFLDNPLWELLMLVVNIIFFIYLLIALNGRK